MAALIYLAQWPLGRRPRQLFTCYTKINSLVSFCDSRQNTSLNPTLSSKTLWLDWQFDVMLYTRKGWALASHPVDLGPAIFRNVGDGFPMHYKNFRIKRETVRGPMDENLCAR